jgi:two-component system LytT family response regulator
MSYRCVVVDDEKPAREKLKRLLAAHEDFEVVGEAADADAAVALIDATRPDLCFLDVEMPEGDGFDVLRRVKSIPNVIFTTAYDQYAVQAFEVRSLDYLLKPFGKRRLEQALDGAREALRRKSDPSERVLRLLEGLEREGARKGAARPAIRISARKASRIVVLVPAEILWFEAEETLVFAVTTRGRFLVERTLADLEEELGGQFFRSHRGHLVNLAQIAEILPGDAGTFEIVPRSAPDARIPVSRRQARKLKELIPW